MCVCLREREREITAWLFIVRIQGNTVGFLTIYNMHTTTHTTHIFLDAYCTQETVINILASLILLWSHFSRYWFWQKKPSIASWSRKIHDLTACFKVYLVSKSTVDTTALYVYLMCFHFWMPHSRVVRVRLRKSKLKWAQAQWEYVYD